MSTCQRVNMSTPQCTPCLSPCPPPPSPLSLDSSPPAPQTMLLTTHRSPTLRQLTPHLNRHHSNVTHNMHDPRPLSTSSHGSVAGRPHSFLFSFPPLSAHFITLCLVSCLALQATSPPLSHLVFVWDQLLSERATINRANRPPFCLWTFSICMFPFLLLFLTFADCITSCQCLKRRCKAYLTATREWPRWGLLSSSASGASFVSTSLSTYPLSPPPKDAGTMSRQH